MTSTTSSSTSKDYSKLTVLALQKLLIAAKLPISGTKAQLIERLKNPEAFKAAQPQPPPGKIKNPKTGRWINDPALKKKPAAPTPPPGKIKNPKTGRWINDPALKKPPPQPPPGKIKNPKTGRWINDPALKEKRKAEKAAEEAKKYPDDGPKTTYYPEEGSEGAPPLTGATYKKILEKYTIRKGQKEGAYASYYRTGRYNETGRYTNGEKSGTWKGCYDSVGSPKLYQGNYNRSLKDGLWKFFNTDGSVDRWENWVNGAKIGEGKGVKFTSGGGGGGSGGYGAHWGGYWGNHGAYWGTNGSSNKQAPPPQPPAEKKRLECAETLVQHSLYPHKHASTKLSDGDKETLRKTFRRWAMMNHPDKGGDSKKFGVVSGCVDTLVKG